MVIFTQPLLLDRISGALYGAADPAQVFQALQMAVTGLPGATLIVAEAEAGGELAVRSAIGSDAERFGQRVFPSSPSLMGWTWRTRQPLLCQDLLLDPRCSEAERSCGGSGLLIPIAVAGKAEVLIAVYTRAPLAEPEQTLAQLVTIGRMAGLALERFHLRRSKERQVRHLMALHEVSRMLASSLEDRVAMELAVDVAISLFDLDLCAVLLRQPDGYLRVEVSRGIPAQVAAQIHLPADMAPSPALFTEVGCPAVTAFPMAGRQNQMGYLVAGCRSGPLAPEEAQMLSIWTNLAGTALENSHLWEGIVERRETLLRTVLEAAALGHGADPEPADRLSRLVGAVGRRLGWSEQDVRELEHLALLCHLLRVARRVTASGANSPLGLVLSRLAHVPLRLIAAPAVQACYEASLSGKAPPWQEMPREAQVILTVECFLRLEEEAVQSQARENRLSALMAIKAQAGHRFDPAVVEALEAVVWARLSLNPSATAKPALQPTPPATPPTVAQLPKTETPTSLDHLTERELEILQFVAKGLSNREIAGQLFLSEATVKTHVHRILHKLGLTDRTKAAVYLLQRRGGLS